MDLIPTALKTLGEMLRDRGYDPEEFLAEMKAAPLKEIAGTLRPTAFTVDPDIAVYFCIAKDAIKEARVQIQEHLKQLMGDQSDSDSNSEASDSELPPPPQTFLLILHEKMSSNMASILEDLDKQLRPLGGAIQHFYLKELQFNPSHHVLVPKHEKLKESEVRQLIAQYQLKNKFQLPLILKTDIMARYMGLRHGDVARITRVTPMAGQHISYRCCM